MKVRLKRILLSLKVTGQRVRGLYCVTTRYICEVSTLQQRELLNNFESVYVLKYCWFIVDLFLYAQKEFHTERRGL